MTFRICVEKSTNHALILRIVPCGFALEKPHAALAQRQRNFHPLLAKDQIFRGWQEVRQNLRVSHGSSVYLILALIDSLPLSPIARADDADDAGPVGESDGEDRPANRWRSPALRHYITDFGE
jgi:hypothetical protein